MFDAVCQARWERGREGVWSRRIDYRMSGMYSYDFAILIRGYNIDALAELGRQGCWAICPACPLPSSASQVPRRSFRGQERRSLSYARDKRRFYAI